MTRRERHLRILANFGTDQTRRTLQQFTTKDILKFLSDEGIEAVTRHIVHGHRLQQRLNAENRTRRQRSVA